MKDADFVKVMSGKMNPQTVSLFFPSFSLLLCHALQAFFLYLDGEGVGVEEE